MDARILGGLGLLLGLALAPAAIVALFGRSLLYHPTGTTDSELSRLAFRRGWERAQISVPTVPGDASEITLQGLVHPPREGYGPWLVFFGGNAMSIVSGQAVLDYVGGELGFGLATFAYRGYDTSGGKPTQEALQGDALAVVRFLEATFGADVARMGLVGQSLGSGVATYAASALEAAGTPVGGLVLLSPYRSMRAIFASKVPVFPVGFAVPDPYPSEALAPGVSAPVLLIHGEADTLIPIDHAEALMAAFPGPTRLVRIPNQGHNGLWQPPETVPAVQAFVRDHLMD